MSVFLFSTYELDSSGAHSTDLRIGKVLDNISFMRNSGEQEEFSINFSTNKIKTTTGGNMFEDAKDKPKDKWRNIKFEKKYILDEMTESTMDEILDTIYYIE